MYEWAKYQPDFKAEMEQLRKEKFRNEDDIEKFAFFKIFEKVNNLVEMYNVIENKEV